MKRLALPAFLLLSACTTPGDDVREGMQRVMGPLPAESRKVPLDVTVDQELRLEGYRQIRLSFAVEPGDRVPALLLIPHGLTGRSPAMLCLHQTVGHGKMDVVGQGKPNMAYGAELAARGFVVLAPDYPGVGDYKVDVYKLGYESASMKGIWNHSRAIDLLQSLPDVDPQRIGVIGHSLGGHNALFLAAFDRRVKAVVTSCGFTSFAKYKGGDLTGWSHKGYMPRIATEFEADPSRMPFDFAGVLRAIAPRPLFINAPLHDDNFDVSGVRDCVEAVRPLYPGGDLVSVYPDAGHDFPPEVRRAACEFLERSLR